MGPFPGKKILVTGAAGFVGSHLARRLLEDGADVSIFVRRRTPEVEEFELAGARCILGDLRDREAVFAAVKGIDVVFHIAALFRQAKHSEEIYHQVNVEGVRHVLDAAEHHGVKRVVHCSTVGVHSHIPKPPADEDEPFRPADIYQETKCEGEKLARTYFDSGRVKGTIIRPAMIWGEGDRRMLKLYRGVKQRKFPVIGSGKTLTHWIYVHDLVEAFILAAHKEEAIGKTYIIAGQEPVSIADLVQVIADTAGVKPLPLRIPAGPVQMLGTLTECVCRPFGVEPPIYRRRVDFFTKDRCFNTKRAREDLGFKPKYSVRTEIERIYRWYEENGWLN